MIHPRPIGTWTPSRGAVSVVGPGWAALTSETGTLHVHVGPGPIDLARLWTWLAGGCGGTVPVRQGFVAVLEGADGAVTAAASPRLEVTALYAADEGRLFLASHPRDLAKARGCRPQLSVAKLADLTALYDDPGTTVFEGVHRLPLGHVLRWRPGQSAPDVRRWFRPETTPDDGIDPAAAPRLMREAVRGAVAASLPAAGDVAATLSGGLDSSMVVATAADLLRPSRRLVHTGTHVPLPGAFSQGIWEADDGPYAERMATEVPGLSWTALTNTALTSPFDVARAGFGRDWLPVLNPANHVWIEAAQQLAVRVGSPLLLTGATGNGPFSRGAAGPLRSLAAARDYRSLGRHLRLARRTGGSWRRAVRPVLAASAPGLAPTLHRMLGRPGGARSTFADLLPLRPELLSVEAQALVARLGRGSPPNRASWVDFVLADRSLLGRCPQPVWWSDPLSDPEVMSLALRLPEEAWLAGGRSRGLAREAAHGLVPDHIRLRHSRGGQSHDLGIWLQGRERHLAALYEQVAASPTAQQFLDLPKLRAQLRPPDPTGTSVISWEASTGRALGFGLFAAWYESEILHAG